MGDECGFGCFVGLAVRGGGEQSLAGWVFLCGGCGDDRERVEVIGRMVMPEEWEV